MLVWITALHCEAKPVIDWYRLKKSHAANPFDLYLGDDMACIVGGIGKIAAAAATAWSAARFADAASLAWFNLGVAGAARHELGSIFLLDQVIDADSGQRYYPAPPPSSRLAGHACMTLSQPSEDYLDAYLFDMEASGFVASALRCGSAELLRSVKVISDNREHLTGRRAQAVSDLLQQRMPAIAGEAESLHAVDREVAALVPPPDGWRRLLALAHFSETQQNRLRPLWRYLALRRHDPDALLDELAGCGSGKAIIEALERIGRRDSERL